MTTRPSARVPRKLTVTRVAALRSRQITGNGIRAFRRAATADGADRSGLTALTYATMMTYAVDAAVAVALANTLFFAAATAESKANVALYLAITVAPFALVAPVIGPLLDRLQRGRRMALAASFAGRGVLAVVMALQYDTWLLYPAALGVMVLSKSFAVLKAAVTPRVLPSAITLVTTNSRLTTFGLASGAVFGAVAAGVAEHVRLTGRALLHGGAGDRRHRPVPADPAVGRVHRGRGARGDAHHGAGAPQPDRAAGAGVAVGQRGDPRAHRFPHAVRRVRGQGRRPPRNRAASSCSSGSSAPPPGIGSFAGNAVGSRQRFGRSDTVVLACIAGVRRRIGRSRAGARHRERRDRRR